MVMLPDGTILFLFDAEEPEGAGLEAMAWSSGFFEMMADARLISAGLDLGGAEAGLLMIAADGVCLMKSGITDTDAILLRSTDWRLGSGEALGLGNGFAKASSASLLVTLWDKSCFGGGEVALSKSNFAP